jgi:hypothetical protein
VFHAVSSPADPDQTGGHEPRPSVTIRQRSRRAAVVGLMVGPTTGLSPVRIRFELPIAQPRPVVAQSGCATGRGSCAVAVRGAAAQSGLDLAIYPVRTSGHRTAQVPIVAREACVCASVRGVQWPHGGWSRSGP